MVSTGATFILKTTKMLHRAFCRLRYIKLYSVVFGILHKLTKHVQKWTNQDLCLGCIPLQQCPIKHGEFVSQSMIIIIKILS